MDAPTMSERCKTALSAEFNSRVQLVRLTVCSDSACFAPNDFHRADYMLQMILHAPQGATCEAHSFMDSLEQACCDVPQ